MYVIFSIVIFSWNFWRETEILFLVIRSDFLKVISSNGQNVLRDKWKLVGFQDYR